MQTASIGMGPGEQTEDKVGEPEFLFVIKRRHLSECLEWMHGIKLGGTAGVIALVPTQFVYGIRAFLFA